MTGMISAELDYQSDVIAAKAKHYLISTMGRIFEEANTEELYRAISYAIREEIMINWLACARSREKQDVRMLYYLSMEYLPGRILTNNITNLNSNDVIRLVMQKLNRNYFDISRKEYDPGLGNGGLGRLASCFLDSLATHNYPAQAYGLRYQYGIFEQQLWDGLQMEAPDCWLLSENPWEFRRDLRKCVVKYCGQTIPSTNIHGDDILLLKNAEEVWALPFDIPIIGYSPSPKYNVVTLRLWTTKESPSNFQLQRYNAGALDQASENTTLTDVLYPSDNHEVGKRIRLKQEFLLVSASVQDIIHHYLEKHDNFRQFADKIRIQINDTHASLVVAELVRTLTKKYDIPWKKAVDMTVEICGYTNHTILSEALEQWDQHLMFYLLPRQFKVIERLNQEFCNTVRAKYPDDEERVRRMSIIEGGMVKMSHLAIVGSHKVNGVAALHTEILKSRIFKDFYELYPDRFVNMTNGVTQRRWLLHCNSDLAKFITERIGDKWITDFKEIKKLAAFAKDEATLEAFLEIKRKNKIRLIEFINHENKLRDYTGKITTPPPILDANSLFDVQVKRIHEYKRQLLNILQVIMTYHDILANPGHPRVKRTVIFGGKSAASYDTAKDIIRFICCVAKKINRDPDVDGNLKIVYIENYNVSKAEVIIPAADLSEQISTAGMEASGTGNMKFAMNGALTIGTDDGANIEMREHITDEWWPFSFGCSAEEIESMKANCSYNPRDVYNANPKIQRAVDTLRDRTFAKTDEEHQAFSDLYHKLMEMHYGCAPDIYFVLKDLQSYYETQRKVDDLFQQPLKWAEYAIHNIAGMGEFSSDVTIDRYCREIWGLTPFVIQDDIFERVKHEYSLMDVCKAFPTNK